MKGMPAGKTKFPHYGNCDAKVDLDDLFRLASPDLFDTDILTLDRPLRWWRRV
jgi:hypothetical protein